MNDRLRFRVWDNVLKRYFTLKELEAKCIVGFVDGFILGNQEDRYVVEQCIGMTDKKGTLIYEGDIVSDGKDNGCIYWHNTGWACTMFLWQKKLDELEVIGNIHETQNY